MTDTYVLVDRGDEKSGRTLQIGVCLRHWLVGVQWESDSIERTFTVSLGPLFITAWWWRLDGGPT